MRVLHGYSGNMYGGVEAMLATLARQAHLAPGLEHRFALCFDGRLAAELHAAGAIVDRLDAVRFSRPWTVLQARRGFRRLLATARPDAVICHGCWAHAVFGPVARRAGSPLGFWAHDLPAGAHWLERRAARTPPDLAIANSRFVGARLDRLFPGVAVEPIYCPVAPPPPTEPGGRARLRRELDTPADALVIVQASRLEAWKGHPILLDALARLRDRPGWVAWIAGGAQRPHEAAYLDGLKERARAGGIADRLRFLGARSDVPRVLAAADLYCQPNTEPEPFGIAFIEALDAGLPVVATELGGAVEILGGGHGRLVPPSDPGALAGALAALLDDPEARARLAAAGPVRARALCDPAALLGRLHECLAGLVEAARTPA